MPLPIDAPRHPKQDSDRGDKGEEHSDEDQPELGAGGEPCGAGGDPVWAHAEPASPTGEVD